MRVFIATDSFGSTLTAVEAAKAIAQGWKTVRPQDQCVIAPQSDGGPGFIAVLEHSLGKIITEPILDPLGRPCTAGWLWQEQGKKAYIESALACGLTMLPRVYNGRRQREMVLAASTFGVGQLIQAAVEYGAERIYCGLGGSGTNDGGRGCITALAGTCPDLLGNGAPSTSLDYAGKEQPSAYPKLTATDYSSVLERARRRCAGVSIIAATDVDNPLLGPAGAVRVYGPQKGAHGGVLEQLERRNQAWAAVMAKACGEPIAERAGAGAAGGLGAALFALGAKRIAGSQVVGEATGRREALSECDVVITGEGKLDAQSLRGKVVSAVAYDAAQCHPSKPVLAIAGQVELSVEQLQQAGISKSYSLSGHAGSVNKAMSQAHKICVSLAARMAREY